MTTCTVLVVLDVLERRVWLLRSSQMMTLVWPGRLGDHLIISMVVPVLQLQLMPSLSSRGCTSVACMVVMLSGCTVYSAHA